ncbi:MAG: hypothetical protein HC923_06395 [Myxococcales bacterium]|nr:hypothetical protein [Myxococcales bacterium]
MRSTRLKAWALSSAALILSTACGDDDGGTQLLSDGGTDLGPGPDFGPDAGPQEKVLLHFRNEKGTGDYSAWRANITGALQASLQPVETDAFGAVFELSPAPSGVIQVQFTNGTVTTPEEPAALDLATSKVLYHFEGTDVVLDREPMGRPEEGQVVVYYKRPDGIYDGWGLHIWGDVVNETLWIAPLAYAGVDPVLGAYFLVDVAPSGDRVNLIVHLGDLKDPGPDMGFNIGEQGRYAFVLSGSADVTARPIEGVIQGARAHWIAPRVWRGSRTGPPRHISFVTRWT